MCWVEVSEWVCWVEVEWVGVLDRGRMGGCAGQR